MKLEDTVRASVQGDESEQTGQGRKRQRAGKDRKAVQPVRSYPTRERAKAEAEVVAEVCPATTCCGVAVEFRNCSVYAHESNLPCYHLIHSAATHTMLPAYTLDLCCSLTLFRHAFAAQAILMCSSWRPFSQFTVIKLVWSRQKLLQQTAKGAGKRTWYHLTSLQHSMPLGFISKTGTVANK